MKKNFIVYDLDSWEFEFFETEEEAIEACELWMKECSQEGVGEEAMTGGIGYAKIKASSRWKVTDLKSNHSEEEWCDMGYDPDWDEVGRLELKPGGIE